MKSSRDVICTLLSPLPLFVHFCTAIPTSPINFIQLIVFLCLLLFFFAALGQVYALSLGHTYSGINPSMHSSMHFYFSSNNIVSVKCICVHMCHALIGAISRVTKSYIML